MTSQAPQKVQTHGASELRCRSEQDREYAKSNMYARPPRDATWHHVTLLAQRIASSTHNGRTMGDVFAARFDGNLHLAWCIQHVLEHFNSFQWNTANFCFESACLLENGYSKMTNQDWHWWYWQKNDAIRYYLVYIDHIGRMCRSWVQNYL